jgi:hypothetical protein
MTRDPTGTPPDGGARRTDDGAPSAETVFHALARALTDQLDAARRGRVDEVAALADRVDALLAEAREVRVVLSDADRQRLLDLHGQVRLALAQQQTELAGRRDRLRRGREGARGYARTTP